MKDSNGNVYTSNDPRLIKARQHAARINWQLASEALTADYYAPHVTMQDRQRIKEKEEGQALQIEAGEMDHNFTIWQRMNTYLTGDCVAFLP